MNLDFRIGSKTDPTEIAALGARAERLGAAALWSSEAGHDPFLLAQDAVTATRTVSVGTAIAVSYARTPMATATAAWHLQRRSGGRFVLGLGTQVPQHVERRYGAPWLGGVAPTREYVEVLRHIWAHWQHRSEPAYVGRHYRFTLASPEFDPAPLPEHHTPIPIWLAAVGPGMARLSGEVADGVHVHSFHTPEHLASRLLPAIDDGVDRANRSARPVTSSPVFAGVAHDAAEAAALRDHFAAHVAFFASTPAYRPVLDWGGWGDVQTTLRDLVRGKQWGELAHHVPDEMFDAFVTIAGPRELGTILAARYSGLLDQLGLYRGGDRFMDDHDWDVFAAAVGETTT